MKKSLFIIFLFLLLFQNSIAQKKDVKILIKESKEAYEQKDFETSKNKILEAKYLFKSNPPPIVLSLEILSKSQMIKIDPLNDYSQIADTRNLANKYLKNSNSKNDKNFSSVVREYNILKTYPKDLVTFNAQKEAKIREVALQKEREEQEAAEVKVREEKEAAEAKTRQEREAIIRQEQIEKDRIINEAAAIDRQKNRLIAAKADEIIAKDSEKQRKQMEREYSRRLHSFSSLGFQSGEIAKYGLLFESGGSKTIGFRMSARTSLTSEEDILNGSVIENKTEIELGPNFKLFNRLYLNIGAGYGYYDKVIRNDYAGTLTLEKTGYLVATSGVMVRISKVININGGVSFMDIDKAFYKPEITAGISFNFKRKNSY